MRELSVYYCPKCGRYAYYQISRNAVCPKCDLNMTALPISYQQFMNLDCEQRDQLISKAMIESSPSYVHRITAPGKMYNKRELIGELVEVINELEADNKKLNETVEWMHATIWEQLHKIKSMENKLKKLQESSDGKHRKE